MKTARLLIVIVVAAALGALFYRWYGPGHKPALPQVAQPQRVPLPQVRHPIAESAEQAETGEEAQEPLPSLEESDPPLREALSSLLPGRRLEELLILSNLIGRVVLTVDALPRQTLPVNGLPVRQAPGKFLAEEGPGGLFISPDNDRRYAPYVRLVEAVDAEKLVALYVRYYPLFQQAYTDLGYQNRYFNDRLIEVIDHLLKTPEVEQPVVLVRPKVRYLFADPQLESLSAGRKILLRAGQHNAAALKAKLSEIREELIKRQVKRQ